MSLSSVPGFTVAACFHLWSCSSSSTYTPHQGTLYIRDSLSSLSVAQNPPASRLLFPKRRFRPKLRDTASGAVLSPFSASLASHLPSALVPFFHPSSLFLISIFGTSSSDHRPWLFTRLVLPYSSASISTLTPAPFLQQVWLQRQPLTASTSPSSSSSSQLFYHHNPR